MDPRVHLFGIRHHGPGSAASLLAALDALQPEAVLIEGPPEADDLIRYAALPGMKPPLAMLAWAIEKPACSSFYPFAAFSPEWQAMRWALAAGRPVRFIDLPVAATLAALLAAQASEEMPSEEPPPEAETAAALEEDAAGETADDAGQDGILGRGDPLDRLAAISGHEDGEALWNALVESRGAAKEVFAAIASAMTTLRAETGEDASHSPRALREARREAHMRVKIREALKEFAGPIAVVVGAWHVPALAQKVAASDDKALLKDIARTKVEVTWVPWTESRLASASGYGAGVTSPGWYGHLWSLYESETSAAVPERFSAVWLGRVATMLRAEGQGASTASVIEAARLATGLCAMRGLPMPSLAEIDRKSVV